MTEYVTLPRTPDPEKLKQLLGVSGGATLSASQGQDASGQPRTIIGMTHQDAETVAETRQNLLRECLRLKVRAIVV